MIALFLDSLRAATIDRTFSVVLNTIADGVRVASERIEATTGWDDRISRDAVVDDECDIIENLLGAAYLVCQTQITAITSRALDVRQCVLDEGNPFNAFENDKVAVRALGARLSSDIGLSKVEVLWALASYFKHREEWVTSDWTKLTGLQRITADVVQCAGLKPGSTGNLRTGAESLGNSDYSNLKVFADAIDKWGEKVYGNTSPSTVWTPKRTSTRQVYAS